MGPFAAGVGNLALAIWPHQKKRLRSGEGYTRVGSLVAVPPRNPSSFQKAEYSNVGVCNTHFPFCLLPDLDEYAFTAMYTLHGFQSGGGVEARSLTSCSREPTAWTGIPVLPSCCCGRTAHREAVRKFRLVAGCASYAHFQPAGHHRGITSGIHKANMRFLGVQVAPKCKHLDRTEPN